jgi:hypothetical protein
VLNRETLIDAMDHPEKYRALRSGVRLCGQFVRLTREQQMDVINRTFHGSEMEPFRPTPTSKTVRWKPNRRSKCACISARSPDTDVKSALKTVARLMLVTVGAVTTALAFVSLPGPRHACFAADTVTTLTRGR